MRITPLNEMRASSPRPNIALLFSLCAAIDCGTCQVFLGPSPYAEIRWFVLPL
jgi:hypothetical protein